MTEIATLTYSCYNLVTKSMAIFL